METSVTLSIAEGIADVRLARPAKRNAIDLPMFTEIGRIIDQLATTRGLRAVVLSGEGEVFSAGIDLAALQGKNDVKATLTARSHGPANLFQHAAWGWRTLPVPVIAAVHGVAFGAGCQIMLGADIRIAAHDARLSLMEMRWGLVPDVAGLALIRGVLRDDIARELIYTARIVSGDEAAALGLVTRCAADPLAEAMAAARAIAAQNPEAIRAAKRLMNHLADADTAALLLAESEEQQVLISSAGHAEVVSAAMEKRAPKFAD